MAADWSIRCGQILGMEEVRITFQDNNSWINSRYIEALTSAADGEFQNAMNSILYGAISEDKVKYTKLTILDTDVDRVTAISRMNFDDLLLANHLQCFHLFF